jgi:hypothetical protein
MTIRPIALPREQVLLAWRAAVLAYRCAHQSGLDHHAAHDAAVVAVSQVLPELQERDAVQLAIEAVAYAAREHTKWFWGGICGESEESAVGRPKEW